jgi:hypothetical protein
MPWQNHFSKKATASTDPGAVARSLKAMESQWGIDFDTPWKALPRTAETHDSFTASNGRELTVNWNRRKFRDSFTTAYEGLLHHDAAIPADHLRKPEEMVHADSCPPNPAPPAGQTPQTRSAQRQDWGISPSSM